MSSEIANRENRGLDRLPPQQPPSSPARRVLMEHAEMAQMAYDFAVKLVSRKMTPARWRGQPEEATAAILYGAELGLPPIAALQNIFEVYGSPGIYARTAQALLENKGFRFKTLETTNEVATIFGARPGTTGWDDPDEKSTFTIEDARRAGWCPTEEEGDRGGVVVNGVRYRAGSNGKLLGNEKYLTQPRQMLWAKAMMEVCRHLSPATLLGIAYSVEELESEPAFNEPLPAAPASASEPLTVEEILGAPPAEDPTPDQVAAAVTEEYRKIADQKSPHVAQSDPAGSRQTVNQPPGSAARQDHDPQETAASPDLRGPAATPPEPAAPTPVQQAAQEGLSQLAGQYDPPTADPTEPPASPAQNKKLNTLFQDLGLSKAQREDRLLIVAHILGYTLEDPTGMTSGEALKVTEKLLDWMADDKTPVANRVRDILNAASLREAEAAEAAAAAAAEAAVAAGDGDGEAPGQETLL